MVSKNEGGLERLLRVILGVGLISWGVWTSGNYWLDYTIPVHQIPCWEWSNFISHGCLVERGFVISLFGIIPTFTGLIGWCPLKSLFGIK